jgi:hypothetical protein
MGYVERLGEQVDDGSQETLGLGEYVDEALENPDEAGLETGASLLYEAIQSMGTRTVIEDGEEVERYHFFDDPSNDGENAVFGNTKLLNKFVDEFLYSQARDDTAKLPMFFGRTATGKSELSKCIENGLISYSESDDTQLYNLRVHMPESSTHSPNPEEVGKTYGNPNQELVNDNEEYKDSPINTNPLAIFREYQPELAEELEEEINQGRESEIPVEIPEHLDPVSKFLIEEARERYESSEDEFENLLDNYVEVVPWEIERGNGIGKLESEDEFDHFFEQIIGNYEPALIEKYGLNPLAFDFGGVLSNGNPAFATMDDADQYAPVLKNLQSIVDDKKTKLPTGEVFSINTMPLLISNPELDEMQMGNSTGLKPSMERRVERFTMGYLTNYGQEAELLRKMLGREYDLMEDMSPEEADEYIRRPLFATKEDGTEVEIGPHGIKSAAMAEVASRLEEADIENLEGGDDLSLIERLQLYQKGEIVRDVDGEKITYEKEDFDFPEDLDQGMEDSSINVTFTRDVIRSMTNQDIERQGEYDLDVDDTILPYEILDEIEERVSEEDTISDKDQVYDRLDLVREEITEDLEEDILEAIFKDFRPGKEELNDYIDHLEALRFDESYTTPAGREIDPDPVSLKESEINMLNFDENDYDGSDPKENVQEFRDKLYREFGSRGTEGEIIEDPRELEQVKNRIGDFDWDGIPEIRAGEFENFSLDDWKDKKVILNTDERREDLMNDTARVKNIALENMVEHQDYSPASALLTTREVVDRVK